MCELDGMEKIVCRASAKVPIVKCWDPELKLACDLNVNNPMALENTRMIRTYVQLDDRVRPLAKIIKFWTKRRILNDAGESIANIVLMTVLLTLASRRRYHQLIHLDLHDPQFPSTAKSTGATFTTEDARPQVYKRSR